MIALLLPRIKNTLQLNVTLKNSLNISSVAIYSIIDDLLKKKLILRLHKKIFRVIYKDNILLR